MVSGREVLLISEASVYTDHKGDFIARGGGAASFHNMALSLVKNGFKPTVFALREFADQQEFETIEGVDYVRAVKSGRMSFRLIRYLYLAKKFAKNYEIVFLNQFLPHFLTLFLRKKFTISVIHDVYLKSYTGFWIKQYGVLKGIFGGITERMELFFDKHFAKKIVTVSPASLDKIINIMGENVREKIFLLPNPIDLSGYISDAKKEDILLFVGRFVNYKNPKHLLYVLKEIQKKYKNFKAMFVVTRDFPKVMRDFEKYRKELGILKSHVILKNFCSPEDLRMYYAKAKILVHPSFVEGQGIVVLEALASNTPVVAYNLPAYNGMLVEGENSELADQGNMDQMVEACFKVLGDYDRYRSSCGNVLKNFSTEMHAERMRELIH